MAEYIDRQLLYKKVSELEELARERVIDTPTTSPAYTRYSAQLTERTAMKRMVSDAPAADVAAVVHGHWILDSSDEYANHYSCSRCGGEIDLCNEIYSEPTPEYCQHCGAKMDEGEVTDV